MQLYRIVSIVVVLLSTASLFIIFHQKNLKDIRYQLGLIASAVISLISGLAFPKLVSAISANLALQLFISVFLSLLLYILVLFLILMLVSMFISKEKADKLLQQWEEKKKSIQEAIKSRKKEKETVESKPMETPVNSPSLQNEGSVQQPTAVETVNSAPNVEIDAASASAESESPSQEPSIEEIKAVSEVETVVASVGTENENLIQEPSTSIDEIELKPEMEIAAVSTDTENENLVQELSAEEMESIQNVEIAAVSNDVESENPVQEPPATEATIAPVHLENNEVITEPQTEPVAAQQDRFEEVNPAVEQHDTAGGEDEIHSEDLPVDEAGGETDLFDDAALLLENSLEKNENDEKNVDTSDIIDKMGIDMIPERAYPIPDQGQSLNEIIDKAFQLKQQGNEIEAAALYMIALDKNPDNETAFWIVLDICAIYKATGHADLAEDILLTYIDTFEDMMSEEVKDQILLSLYDK